MKTIQQIREKYKEADAIYRTKGFDQETHANAFADMVGCIFALVGGEYVNKEEAV